MNSNAGSILAVSIWFAFNAYQVMQHPAGRLPQEASARTEVKTEGTAPRR